jgi:hypothetical protein
MPDQAAAGAVHDTDALKRFLTEKGMEDMIAFFTDKLKIKNLLVLKVAVEDKTTDGMASKIREALKKSDIPYALEMFAAITADDVAKAIERERQRDADDPDKSGAADVKKFDETIAGGSASLKLLGKFLRDRALNSGRVLTVLQTSGVNSLPELKALRVNEQQWAGAAKKVAACGKACGTLFNRITDWVIAAAIHESTQPSPEQTEARKKAVADAIVEVEKLRTELAGANEETYKQKKAALQAAYDTIVGRLAKFDLDFAAAEKPAGQEAMADLFTRTMAQIENVKADLSGVEKEPRSLEMAIVRGDMLRGYLLTPVSVEKARENLVGASKKAPDILNPGSYDRHAITYKTSSTTAFGASSADSLGSDFAAAGKASGAGYVGSGIAAVSVAASVVDNSIKTSQESQFETMAEATCGEIYYVYDPRQKIRFARMPFTDVAVTRLQEIADTANVAARRVAAARFMEIFGSHFFLEVTLGGRYEFRATGTSIDRTKKSSLQTAVVSARTWAVSASASYKGIGNAVSAAASVISAGTHATAAAGSYVAKNSEARVDIETKMLGGAHGVPRDVWASSLQYNATWEVIGREAPMAVWEMLAESEQFDTPARASLKALFEEVWVQDIFAAGQVNRQYLGLRDALKDRGIRTARALKEFLENYTAPAPTPVTPKITIKVVASEQGWAYDPTARADKAEPGYKLIGGGAKAEWKTMGSLLTGSYPDQGAWVARAIAHNYPTDTKITAYAIYLHDPDNEWEVTIKEATSDKDEPDHLKTITAILPDGFVLTCGGARAEGGSRLLTKSYPGPDRRSWIAESRDHNFPSKGGVTAWAIGIRPTNGAKLPTLVIGTQVATGQIPTISRSTPHTLVGGGARVDWTGPGGLLTRSYPDQAKNEWCVQAKDHIGPDAAVTLTVYTMALSTAAALSVSGS